MMIGAINITGNNLFYDGTGEPYDMDYARLWKSRVPQKLVEVTIFGEKEKQWLPLLDIGENVTYEFQRQLGVLTQSGKLTHYRLRSIQEVLKNYNVLVNDKGDVGLSPKKNDYTYDLRSLLLAKEMLDGYYNLGVYRGKNEPTSTPIGSEYDITIRGKEYQVFGSYAPALRQKIFDGTLFSQEKGKLLQDWQVMYHIIMGHITWVLCKRGGGKSRVNSEIAIREITKQRNKGKPNQVVYISANDTKLEDVRIYVREFASSFPGVYEFANDTLSFYTYEETDGITQKILNGYITFISGVASSPGVGTHAGLYILDEAGLLKESVFLGLIDVVSNEGARMVIISTVYESVGYDHWFFKGWMDAYAKSLGTNIPEIIEDFFVENYETIKKADLVEMGKITDKLKYEIGTVGYLITNDMVEIHDAKNTREVELLNKYKSDEYFAQCWGVIPEGAGMFEIGHIIHEVADEEREFYIITWDPAKEGDMSALTVSAYKDLHIYDLEEHILNENREDYPEQMQMLQDVIDKYKGTGKRVYKVIDYRGVGQNIAGFLNVAGITFDAAVNVQASVANGRDLKSDGVWSVGKEYLVDLTKTLIRNRNITIAPNLTTTIAQYKTFAPMKSVSGKTGYQGEKKKKDDFVSASMIRNFFVWNIMGKGTAYARKKMEEIRIKKSKEQVKTELTIEQMQKMNIERQRKNKVSQKSRFNPFFY